MMLVLPDCPGSAPFLEDEQRKVAVARVQAEQLSEENKTIKLYQNVEALLAPRLR